MTNINYIKAGNSTQDLSRYTSTNVLNADAGSGHTSVVTFTPTTVGTFGFFSEDEESLGMVGKFVVLTAGGQAAPAPAPSSPAAAAPSASATVAKDGQSLASQSAATQALFNAVWGQIFALAKRHAALPPVEIEKLLNNPEHNVRVGAVSIMA